jgi:hypothetical protein
MAGHICDNCGATVTNEQFCPTCGAWVDPLSHEDGGSEFEEFSLGAEPREPAQPARLPRQEVQCPSCGSPNPTTNRHCEECGARLAQGAMPVAPRPAVQTTAGVRAAMGISAVLVVVILAVLIVNLFGDAEGEPTTSLDAAAAGSTTTTAPIQPTPVDILDVECNVEAVSGFSCDNLVDGSATNEWQVTWTGIDPTVTPTITLKFNESVLVRQIIWTNITDEDRFLQNLKVQRINISDGNSPYPTDLRNEPGPQSINWISLPVNQITIEITAEYPAVPVGDQIFEELAIAEIQVLGTPAAGAAPAVVTSSSITTETTAG